MKRKLKHKKNNRNITGFLKENKGIFIMLFVSIFVFFALTKILRVNNLKASIAAVVIYLLYLVPLLYRVITHKPKAKGTKLSAKKLIKWGICAISVLIIAFVVFFAMVAINSPEFDPSQLYRADASTIYFADGSEVDKIGAENRQNITYDQMSENLINAIIATEDSRFFQHNGFDLPRFIIAAVKQVLGNRSAGGASTLTMQVIKNTYTSTEDEGIAGIIRKFTDIYMAIFKVEKHYTKEQILEFYVNSNYLGASSYGVEQAAQTYFGKDAADLSLPEAAMIAGLFNAPDYLDPLKYPQRAEKRRLTVLYQMFNHGYITEEEYNIAKEVTVQNMLNVSKSSGGNYQGVIDTVVAEVQDKLGVNPYTTSMQIYTTFDRGKQDAMNDVMSGATFDWEDGRNQGGIVVLDTQTSAIIALGANRNQEGGALQYNYATQINKQIGSTAKPLYDYGPAIEFENWSSYSPVTDEPYAYSDGTRLVNWNNTYEGFLTSRQALVGSRNIPAVKAFQANNRDNIVKFVKGFGLTPDMKEGFLYESHAIGGYNGESPLTMAAAYAAFGNGGYYNQAYSVKKVVYTDTNETWEYKSQKTRVVSEETAYIVYDMLRSTCFHAIGFYCNYINSDVGVKTGTTNFDDKTIELHPQWPLSPAPINDSWVDGVSSKYAVSVWLGYDKIHDDYVRNVNNIASWRLFYTVAQFTFQGDDAKVQQPSGVKSIAIENETYPAQLPSANTPSNLIITELFKEGSEPTETSTRFETLKNVTNLKTTYKNGYVNISWDPIPTPDALNENKIKDLASKLFTNEGYRNSFVANRQNYNNNYMGNVVYKVYYKDAAGGLTAVGTTADNNINYKLKATDKVINFVVKTSYSIFTSATSGGANTSYTVTGNEKIAEITAKLIGGSSITLEVGDALPNIGVSVYEGGSDVTKNATIITKTTKNGAEVVDIDTSKVGEYKISYNVTYGTYNNVFEQKVSIVEAKQKEDD